MVIVPFSNLRRLIINCSFSVRSDCPPRADSHMWIRSEDFFSLTNCYNTLNHNFRQTGPNIPSLRVLVFPKLHEDGPARLAISSYVLLRRFRELQEKGEYCLQPLVVLGVTQQNFSRRMAAFCSVYMDHRVPSVLIGNFHLATHDSDTSFTIPLVDFLH